MSTANHSLTLQQAMFHEYSELGSVRNFHRYQCALSGGEQRSGGFTVAILWRWRAVFLHCCAELQDRKKSERGLFSIFYFCFRSNKILTGALISWFVKQSATCFFWIIKLIHHKWSVVGQRQATLDGLKISVLFAIHLLVLDETRRLNFSHSAHQADIAMRNWLAETKLQKYNECRERG